MLYAAEEGNLDELLRLLDKSALSDKVADVNYRGLD